MKKISTMLITAILFTTFNFSIINAQENNFESSKNKAIVSGQVIGIHYKIDGYYVENTFSNKNPIKKGSILKRIIYKDPRTNQTISFVVKDDSQVKNLYKLDDNLKVNALVQRKNKLELVKTNVYHLRHTKLQNTAYSYATLTSVNPDTLEYSAVAHPLSICGNSNYKIEKGYIFLADTVYNAKRHKLFSSGFIDADIKDNPVGIVTQVSNVGIRGFLTDINAVKDCPVYTVAKYDEIRLGEAYILSQDNKTNKIIKSKIEITEIGLNKGKKSSTIYFNVVDKNLIKERGGAVKGMSGSPIIQNGKIIGALASGSFIFTKLGGMTYIGYMIENN